MDAKTLEITVFQLNFWTSADVLGSGGWCRRRESNPRPRDYETLALPLSYAGTKQLIMLRSPLGEVKPCLRSRAWRSSGTARHARSGGPAR